MELIADILMILGTLGAGIYCVVLSRRLRRFTDLENGVGGAIAILAVQVDGMTKTLELAQTLATDSVGTLGQMTTRAEDAARRLELLVASMHDIPAQSPKTEVSQDHNGPTFLSKRSRFQGAAE